MLAFFLIASALQNSGDAPAPYPTASHGNTSWEHLGATVSNDAANPVTPAWTGSADDDGVTVVNLVKGGAATFEIDVQSLYSSDDVAVWADWNDDGTWDAVAERVIWAGASASAPNGPLTDGVNSFDVAVPASAVGTTAKIRVRIWDTSSFGAMANGGADGGGDPAGATTWGEVEDYEIAYVAANAGSSVVLPAGSAFSGSIAGGFDLTVQAGDALVGADLQLTDADGDAIDLNDVTAAPGPIGGVTAPAAPQLGLASGTIVSWTGTVDASTTAGVYTYLMDIDDNANPNVVFEVRITVTAAPPPGGGGTTPPPSSGGTPATESEPVPNTGGRSGRGPGGLFYCSVSGAVVAGPWTALLALAALAFLKRR